MCIRDRVTGTSDKLPIEAQLQMMRQMLPDAQKLGIMYTTSEANSVSAIEEYEKLSGDYGFQLVTKGITATADIPLAADELLSEVDCITNLTCLLYTSHSSDRSGGGRTCR